MQHRTQNQHRHDSTAAGPCIVNYNRLPLGRAIIRFYLTNTPLSSYRTRVLVFSGNLDIRYRQGSSIYVLCGSCDTGYNHEDLPKLYCCTPIQHSRFRDKRGKMPNPGATDTRCGAYVFRIQSLVDLGINERLRTSVGKLTIESDDFSYATYLCDWG